MPEKGNKPSEVQFTDLVDQIVITIAIVIDHIISDYNKPEDIMNDYLSITSSDTKVAKVFASLALVNINNETGVFPAKIRRQIIEISRGLYEKSQKDFLTNSPNLSKVLKEFEDVGIIFSIVGKKKIKEQSPKSIPRKLKAGEYKQERLEGPAVIKKLMPKVEDYKKVLSNPRALALINNKLIKYGKIEKAYNIIAKKAFYFLKKGGEKEYDFLQAFKILPLPTDLLANNGMLDPKSFQQGFNAISEEELEEWRKQFVRYLLENPNVGLFFIFSLEKIKPDSNS